MKDKRNRHGAVGKSSSEQHFCKSAPLLCEISGVLHLADWLAGRSLALVNQGTASLQPYQCIPAGFFG